MDAQTLQGSQWKAKKIENTYVVCLDLATKQYVDKTLSEQEVLR